jgi:hypothetical protein
LSALGELGFLHTNYGISMDYSGPFSHFAELDYWTSPVFVPSEDPIDNFAYTFTYSMASGSVQWWQNTDDPEFPGYMNYVIPVFDGAPRERWCPADFNNDGSVNFVDFAVFASYWLHQREVPQPQ